LEAGTPVSTPVAIIENGTCKDQKLIIGTLENILTYNEIINSPALIVVGEVVKLREEMYNISAIGNKPIELLQTYEVLNEVLPYLS
jgi:siroheme synthase